MVKVNYPAETTQASDHIEDVIASLKDGLNEDYQIFADFLVESSNQHVDLLVISPHALFAIEVPNLLGLVAPYIGEDTLWTHGVNESSKSNPFQQVEESVAAVQDLLRTKMRGADLVVERLIVLPSKTTNINKNIDTGMTDDDRARVLKHDEASAFIADSYLQYRHNPENTKILSPASIERMVDIIGSQATTPNDNELEYVDINDRPEPLSQPSHEHQAVISTQKPWHKQTANVLIMSVVAVVLIVGGYLVSSQYINRTTGCQPPGPCEPPPPPPPTRLPDGTISAPSNGSVINQMGVQFVPYITDPDKQITDYHWVFGDGTESRDITPYHLYAKAGDYTTSLTLSGQRFETFSAISKITISDDIPDRACDPSKPIPNLVQGENPVIILTREETGQEFAIKNGLYAPLDAKGFVSIDPTVLANIQDTPIIERIWKGDCDSMASLAAYFNSYTIITVQYFLEQTSTTPIAFLATVQLVALNPLSGKEMFRDFKESVARGVSENQAQRNALLAAATMGGELLAEKLTTYFEN